MPTKRLFKRKENFFIKKKELGKGYFLVSLPNEKNTRSPFLVILNEKELEQEKNVFNSVFTQLAGVYNAPDIGYCMAARALYSHYLDLSSITHILM